MGGGAAPGPRFAGGVEAPAEHEVLPLVSIGEEVRKKVGKELNGVETRLLDTSKVQVTFYNVLFNICKRYCQLYYVFLTKALLKEWFLQCIAQVKVFTVLIC